MSNRRKSRTVAGNSARARAAFPAYVTPAALCDVPACARNVAGSRTITLVPKDRAAGNLSVLIRLCRGHVTASYDELVRLLPQLAELNDAAGPAAYLGPDAAQ